MFGLHIVPYTRPVHAGSHVDRIAHSEVRRALSSLSIFKIRPNRSPLAGIANLAHRNISLVG